MTTLEIAIHFSCLQETNMLLEVNVIHDQKKNQKQMDVHKIPIVKFLCSHFQRSRMKSANK